MTLTPEEKAITMKILRETTRFSDPDEREDDEEILGYAFSQPGGSGAALGYALFPAAADRLREETSAAALHSGDKTFTAGGWFRHDFVGTSALACTGVSGGPGNREWKIVTRQSDGFVTLNVSADGTTFTSAGSITGQDVTAWSLYFFEHHASDDVIRLWVDGVLRVTTPHATGVASGSNKFAIGAADADPANSGLIGAASRIAYWDRALSSTEHADLYASQYFYVQLPTSLKTSLVAWWDLTSESGTTWADSHTNGLDLTDVTGDVTVGRGLGPP